MKPDRFWQAVNTRLAAGVSVFVALVVAHTRGSPGTTGARLWLDGRGTVAGTVGGGVMERDLIARGQRALAGNDRTPRLERLVHRDYGEGQRSGLICAGEQTLLLAVLAPGHDEAAVARFAAAHELGEAATLAIDPSGLHVAAGAPEFAVPQMRLVTRAPSDWRYMEDTISRRRLAVVGAGHCGQALARLADEVGYTVALFDDRPERLDAVAGTGSLRCHAVGAYGQVAARIEWPAQTAVVVMTSGMASDVAALETLAPLACADLAVMGSRTKIRAIRRALAECGVSAAAVGAIRGPVGLSMKSDTPAEIAVSVVGELLRREAGLALGNN